MGVKVLPGIGLIKMQTSLVHPHSRRCRCHLACPNLVLFSFKLDHLDTHTHTHARSGRDDKCTARKKNKSPNFFLWYFPQHVQIQLAAPRLFLSLLSVPAPLKTHAGFIKNLSPPLLGDNVLETLQHQHEAL